MFITKLLSMFLVAALFVVMAIKPLLGEMEFHKFEKTAAVDIKKAKNNLLAAISYDEMNMVYLSEMMKLSMFQRNFVAADMLVESLINNNSGDITPWWLWERRGDIHMASGDMYGAKQSFETAIYYNNINEIAENKLKIVNNIINSGRLQITYGKGK